MFRDRCRLIISMVSLTRPAAVTIRRTDFNPFETRESSFHKIGAPCAHVIE